jgi:hypothetical protein
MEAVVGQGKLSRWSLREFLLKRRNLYMLAAILLVAIVAAIVVIIRLDRKPPVNTVAQKQLQSQLQDAENATNSAAVVSYTGQLIDGAKQGIYVISNTDLGLLHLKKASALSTLGENQAAIPEYKAAAQLNSSLNKIALAGEVEARYALGERQQLIPLLRQLVTEEQKSSTTDPAASGMASIYQNAIQAIQNNQEVSL